MNLSVWITDAAEGVQVTATAVTNSPYIISEELIG